MLSIAFKQGFVTLIRSLRFSLLRSMRLFFQKIMVKNMVKFVIHLFSSKNKTARAKRSDALAVCPCDLPLNHEELFDRLFAVAPPIALGSINQGEGLSPIQFQQLFE